MTNPERILCEALDAIIKVADRCAADKTSYPGCCSGYQDGAEAASDTCAEIARNAIRKAFHREEGRSAVDAVIEARQRFNAANVDDDDEYHGRLAALVNACEYLEQEVTGTIKHACETCEGRGQYDGIGNREIECHVCHGAGIH